MQFDIAIVTLPGTVFKGPPAAPAILKSSLSQAGFSSKIIDFNIRFYNTVKTNLQELESFFILGLDKEKNLKLLANQIVDSWADEIISYNPKYIGISVFTYQNRTATRMLCESIKKKSDIKIVLGGQGLSNGGILGSQTFGEELKTLGLCDFYIKSEGEKSLIRLLQGDTGYKGINSDTFLQIDNLDDLPIPDYSDYDMASYVDKVLPITASRGCVRSCSFCDIHSHWKYKFRSSSSIASEIISHYEKYDITKFHFTDSLVNGSLREFKKFCKILGEYNEKHYSNITWSGQFIIRSGNQLNDEFWENLAKSGASMLAIGIETGSDTVREHMNKKFTNKDIDYTMQMLEKYNISCTYLLIIGYPTETDDDFHQTLELLKKYKHLAGTVIKNINFGSTLGILPGTPLYNRAQEFNIELDKHENNWIALNNSELTLQKRIDRRRIAKDYALSLGYTLENDTSSHMLEILEKYIPVFDKRNKTKKMIQIKIQNRRK